ncbi:LysR family transcriptional regulator [Borborobacter arsenicus]|uniref:LysR family transcriptional regulator n=1 Tax=Borborobacter arsenicus TaxID=1851146 RepID=UPI00140433EE|nr:LysR family transcriptional regulator [Pseudaminobacter arsenicus]
MSGLSPGRLERLDSTSIASLRIFLLVVANQSFSKTARQLQIAPSTVSKHVDMLEQTLNTALVRRTTRQLSITDDGAVFYEHCKSVLATLDEVVGNFAGAPAELEGWIRMVAPPSFAMTVLADRLPEFQAQHPRLALDVHTTTAKINLIREGVDVAIWLQDAGETYLRSIRLAPNPCVWCVSPDYIERHGKPSTPADLATHSCLKGIGTPFQDHWPIRSGTKVGRVAIDSSFATDNGEVLRKTCLAGLGIAGFYLYHVADDLRKGRLVEVLADYQADISSIYAVMPHRRLLPAKVRAFVEFLRKITSDLPRRVS